MGSVGDAFGQLGSASGLTGEFNMFQDMGGDIFGGLQSDFRAKQAGIENPLQPGQLQGAVTGNQNALDSQQQLANLLAGQGGMQNQQNVFGQQQNLANILQQQAMGNGPNPAQAALAQSTSNNMAQQASLMAGQRGASGNAGLMARQIGQQGAGIQQQAVGQAATMQAQQQIAAQQQLAGQQQAMQNVAGNQIGNQIAGQGALSAAHLNNQGQMFNANNGFNTNMVANNAGANAVNAHTSEGNAQVYGNLLGGAMQGAGSAAGMMAMARGGVVDDMGGVSQIYHPTYSGGGKVPAMVSPGEQYIPPSEVKEVASGQKSVAEAGEKIKGKAPVKGDSPKNDVVPKDLEEGGIVIPKSVMESDNPLKEGKKFLVEALKKHGKQGKEESEFHGALKKAIASRSAS